MKAPPTESFTMLLVVLALPLMAQKNEIVSTAGDSFATEAGYLSFTLGEVAIETLPASPRHLTQGFHQPLLFVSKPPGTVEVKQPVEVFPNPVGTVLYIKSTDPTVAQQYTVLDIRGIRVREGLVKDHTEVSFEGLPAATYTLQIRSGARKMQFFKIVKQQ
jgi:hypothetical protein